MTFFFINPDENVIFICIKHIIFILDLRLLYWYLDKQECVRFSKTACLFIFSQIGCTFYNILQKKYQDKNHCHGTYCVMKRTNQLKKFPL